MNAQSPTILRDSTGQRLSGALAPGATALWIGLDGDAGGWITVAGLPSVDSPDLPSIAADVALAADAPLGPVTLRLIAIDGDERAGEATTVQLVAGRRCDVVGDQLDRRGLAGALVAVDRDQP